MGVAAALSKHGPFQVLASIFKAREPMGERTRRVALAALAGLAQRAAAIIGTFLMFPLVLHAIGPSQFGVWGAATSLILLITIADFGIGPAIMTLVPRALASGDADRPRELFTAALIIACGLSCVTGLTGFLIAWGSAPKPELACYLIAIGGVAINIPLGAANPVWMALQRGWMVAFWDLVQTLFLVAGLATAIHFTTNVRLYVFAVYAALLLTNGSNLVWLLIRHPEIRPAGFTKMIKGLRVVITTGFSYFVLTALDALLYMLDNVLALQLLGPTASAKMAVVQKICVASIGLVLVVSQPLWPAFVDAATRGDRRWLLRTLIRGSALVTIAAIAGSCLILVFGLRFIKLWLGSDIGIDQHLLWIMGFWIVSLSLVRVQMLLLNALKIVKFQILVFSLVATIAISLKILMAPIYGVAGILIATAVVFPLVVLPAVIWRTNAWNKRSDITLNLSH